MKKILLISLIFLLGIGMVYGLDNLQQYNKIFLNPFYRVSMTQNTNYTYNFTVNPPDKISSVLSAVVNLQVYMTPTVTFTIWVNTKPCNTASYTVSTTYATSGQGMITFDCSNVITTAGFFNVTIRPTSANTGASTVWIDITYVNNQSDYVGSVGSVSNVTTVKTVDNVTNVNKVTSVDNVQNIKGQPPNIFVAGTDYFSGEPGKIFLQISDNGKIIESNTSSCRVTVYYPNVSSFFIEDQAMIPAPQGLMYYPFVAPETEGIYMVTASCEYYLDKQWYFDEDDLSNPTKTVLNGTCLGSEHVLNSYLDWLYNEGHPVYNANTGEYILSAELLFQNTNLLNFSDDDLVYMGETNAELQLYLSYYDWTLSSWVDFPGYLQMEPTAIDVPSGIDVYFSVPLPNTALNASSAVRIKFTAVSNNNFTLWTNWVNLFGTKKITSTSQTIRGGGEIHITNLNKDNLEYIRSKTENMPVSKGTIDVLGTEYSPNDEATMFLQLKDIEGIPITDGACWVSVWYPRNASNIHPLTILDAPMLKAEGNEGIYYYDMFAPTQLGVYMVSAKCSYSFNYVWIYPEDELMYYPIPERNTGTWIGNATVLNSRQDDNYERCDATAAIICSSNYTFNTSQYGTLTNISSVNLYYLGQGDVVAKTVTFAYWNGAAYVNLPNTLVTVATGATATLPGDVDQFVTNSIPTSAIIGNTIKIRITTPTGLARYYNNWLSLSLLSSEGTVQDLKGSSEMHVVNIPNATTYQIWNHFNRTLTNYSEQTISNFVWNNNVRTLTYYNMSDTTNYTLISQNVWTYINRSLTQAPENTTAISFAIWNAASRTLTYYNMTDTTNYNLLGLYVWNTTLRNLTYYNMTDTTNYNLLGLYVWNTTLRNLTYYPTTDLSGIASAVWLYSTRNLTYINNTAIAEAVWNWNGTIVTSILEQIANTIWQYLGGKGEII